MYIRICTVLQSMHKTRHVFDSLLRVFIFICVCIYTYIYVQYIHTYTHSLAYGVATISRLLKIIGLFCRISSLL